MFVSMVTISLTVSTVTARSAALLDSRVTLTNVTHLRTDKLYCCKYPPTVQLTWRQVKVLTCYSRNPRNCAWL